MRARKAVCLRTPGATCLGPQRQTLGVLDATPARPLRKRMRLPQLHRTALDALLQHAGGGVVVACVSGSNSCCNSCAHGSGSTPMRRGAAAACHLACAHRECQPPPAFCRTMTTGSWLRTRVGNVVIALQARSTVPRCCRRPRQAARGSRRRTQSWPGQLGPRAR